MSKTLLALTGNFQSGKDTVADRVIEVCGEDMVEKRAIAYPLKKLLSDVLGIDMETLDKLKTLDTPITPYSDHTARKMMQEVGQRIKDLSNDNQFWVKKVIDGMDIDNKDYVITDVRFDFEEQFLRDFAEQNGMDYICVRVVRDGKTGDTHVSETSIADVNYDYVIYNNGTLDDLDQAIVGVFEDYLTSK